MPTKSNNSFNEKYCSTLTTQAPVKKYVPLSGALSWWINQSPFCTAIVCITSHKVGRILFWQFNLQEQAYDELYLGGQHDLDIACDTLISHNNSS